MMRIRFSEFANNELVDACDWYELQQMGLWLRFKSTSLMRHGGEVRAIRQRAKYVGRFSPSGVTRQIAARVSGYAALTRPTEFKELRKTPINDIVTGEICIFEQESSHELRYSS